MRIFYNRWESSLDVQTGGDVTFLGELGGFRVSRCWV